jgi:4-hydroxythreonine-4-phosphate dehydrogenase
MNASSLPCLAITMGDPAGTGAELLTRALVQRDILQICRPVVVGDARVLANARQYTGCTASIQPVASFDEAAPSEERIFVMDLQNADPAKLQLGTVSAMAGEAAYQYILAAAEAALSGKVAAIVTSAINKEALNKAGHHFDGHTGLLAHICKAPRVTMMLAADNLRVSHVSTHVSLRQAIDRVQPERILEVAELTLSAMHQLGITNPRIAVAGLNPHAGENGLFGNEEARFIQPAIETAREKGWDVSGPYPGDTVFFRTLQGEFDAAIAMYHDQGHVAAKMLGIWRGVNVTLGLPIIRTSVEHGTNFDLSGTGKSDPRSLVEAIRMAARLAGSQSH